MEEQIKKFIQGNKEIEQFLTYPNVELTIMRTLLNLEQIDIYKIGENQKNVRTINICSIQNYNCLENMIAFKMRVDKMSVSMVDSIERVKNINLCSYCKCSKCIRKSLAILIEQVEIYNLNNTYKLNPLSVIDYIIDRKTPMFNKTPEAKFFSNIDVIDLLYVQTILEADLINLIKCEENKIEADYLDLTSKNNNEYYINKLLEYYKNKKNAKHIEIDISNIDDIFKEKDRNLRVYKIATYYKYIIEHEKIDIILKLRQILNPNTTTQGMTIRSHYFVYKYFKKVEELPYSKKTKDKIMNILNYILNYRFKFGTTPYIPINILIYSNDKEGIEKITQIIGEFMWFFGYLAENMKYYNEYMNSIILDKLSIKNLYYEKTKDGVKNKNGMLLLHNFDNLLYTQHMQKNLTLNILSDEIEKNNRNVCTVIYGEKIAIKQLLGNHQRLSQMLINLELEIDNLDAEKVYKLILEKLERIINVSDEIKEKIYNYIKATYNQSEIKNMEYVNKLYNTIILNMNKKFSARVKQDIKLSDIPEAYNTRDLPEIMKDINNLVGLKEIKQQINDLVALLKFNKKANIEIKDFNLHMCFKGNPGTGKTTVGRLITDIFYNLGYINQNKLTEVTAKDLIAEYIGQTSGKTYNVVKSALGGVLFIDEAYAITSGIGNSAQYGNECIATLLKLMEDYKDKLIIIFAGYNDEMDEFLKSNSGLSSRIGYKIKFPDFSLDELALIFTNLLDENKLEITEEALEKLKAIIEESSRYDNFGNGRYIHNVFQRILIEHSKNIENKSKNKNLYLITEEDINYEKLIAENKNRKIGF